MRLSNFGPPRSNKKNATLRQNTLITISKAMFAPSDSSSASSVVWEICHELNPRLNHYEQKETTALPS